MPESMQSTYVCCTQQIPPAKRRGWDSSHRLAAAAAAVGSCGLSVRGSALLRLGGRREGAEVVGAVADDLEVLGQPAVAQNGGCRGAGSRGQGGRVKAYQPASQPASLAVGVASSGLTSSAVPTCSPTAAYCAVLRLLSVAHSVLCSTDTAACLRHTWPPAPPPRPQRHNAATAPTRPPSLPRTCIARHGVPLPCLEHVLFVQSIGQLVPRDGALQRQQWHTRQRQQLGQFVPRDGALQWRQWHTRQRQRQRQ